MTTLAQAVGVAIVATGLALPFLRWLNMMDLPNARSSHTSPVPRGGGIGVVTGIAVVALVGMAYWPVDDRRDLLVVLVALLVLAALGFVDDLQSLDPWIRLIVQLAVSAVAVFLLAFEALPANALSSALFLGLGMLWVTGVTNAFNFMDGINGISAMNGAFFASWFAWIGNRVQSPELELLGLAVAGASVGFLPWNAHRARAFLGDTGSYAIGGAVALLAFMALLEGAPVILVVAPLIIYLADTGWTLLKRLLAGRPWREAHREHVYQRLVDAGWPYLSVAFFTTGWGVVVSLACVSLLHAGGWVAATGGVLICVALYVAAPKALAFRDSAGAHP